MRGGRGEARLQAGEVVDDQLGAVRHQRGDVVARLQTEGEVVAGEPGGGGVEFAPRELAVGGDEGRRIGIAGEVFVEEAGEFDFVGERRTGARRGKRFPNGRADTAA